MAGIFKAYDIRGIYPEQLSEATAEKIGRAIVEYLKAGSVVIGRDMRPHSVPLFQALVKGITEQGADVIDLGMCSTPMCYHANGKLKADASVMITASHNPADVIRFEYSCHFLSPFIDLAYLQLDALLYHGKAFLSSGFPRKNVGFPLHIRTFVLSYYPKMPDTPAAEQEIEYASGKKLRLSETDA